MQYTSCKYACNAIVIQQEKYRKRRVKYYRILYITQINRSKKLRSKLRKKFDN